LISPKRGDNSGIIWEDHLILRGRREQTLQGSDGTVENDRALSADPATLDKDPYLMSINERGIDAMNKGIGCLVKILGAQDGAQLIGLDLEQRRDGLN